MICSSLNRLLRIVRLLADGLQLQARERKGSRSVEQHFGVREVGSIEALGGGSIYRRE
jgi:hypothetical protein